MKRRMRVVLALAGLTMAIAEEAFTVSGFGSHPISRSVTFDVACGT